MSKFPLNDVGDFLTGHDGCASANSGAPSLITAGGALDNVKVTGQAVDRKSGSAISYSAFIQTAYLAALSDTKSLTLAHEYQDSADNSTWNTAVVIEAATTKATSDGGTNERGVDVHKLSLLALDRYVRVNVTPDLTATGTDTCLFFTVITLGGWSQVPQS